jgi:hypothetical protein
MIIFLVPLLLQFVVVKEDMNYERCLFCGGEREHAYFGNACHLRILLGAEEDVI